MVVAVAGVEEEYWCIDPVVGMCFGLDIGGAGVEERWSGVVEVDWRMECGVWGRGVGIDEGRLLEVVVALLLHKMELDHCVGDNLVMMVVVDMVVLYLS